MAFSIQPRSDKFTVLKDLHLVNKKLQKLNDSLKLAIECNDEMCCLVLYKDREYAGQVGTCVSIRQLWRIHERIIAILKILVEVDP